MAKAKAEVLELMALPGSAWVEIEPSAVEVDRRFEVLDVAEPAGHALDLLDLAVEPLAHRNFPFEKRTEPRDQEHRILCCSRASPEDLCICSDHPRLRAASYHGNF